MSTVRTPLARDGWLAVAPFFAGFRERVNRNLRNERRQHLRQHGCDTREHLARLLRPQARRQHLVQGRYILDQVLCSPARCRSRLVPSDALAYVEEECEV